MRRWFTISLALLVATVFGLTPAAGAFGFSAAQIQSARSAECAAVFAISQPANPAPVYTVSTPQETAENQGLLGPRYLNPETGRFWSMDKYEGLVNDPISLHKYLYANSSPLDYADPSGRNGDFTVSGQGMNATIIGNMARVSIRTLVKRVAKKVGCEAFEFVVEEGVNAGIYLFLHEAGLYVGKSIDMDRRLQQHTKVVVDKIAKIKFIGLGDADLRKVEQVMLDELRGMLGLKEDTVNRPGKGSGQGIANKIEPTNETIRSKLRKTVNLELCK